MSERAWRFESSHPYQIRMSYKDRDKQREYQNRWMKSRREAWLKDNGPCTSCGSWEELEVDHIIGNEKVNHRIWSWSKERRDKELAKCQVLCNPCHREKTREELRVKTHGFTMYCRYRCRCDVCTKANRDHRREWVKRNKARVR